MLKTMEMWWLGFYMERFRLALFILLGIPLLVGLSYYEGFEETSNRLAELLSVFTAYAVGFAASGVLLSLFAVIGPGMSANEILGKIALQAVPASIGGMLAGSQLGDSDHKEVRKRNTSYGGDLFLMAVGALYLCASLASTEEIVLISYQMTAIHVVVLLVFSVVVMNGFVYAGIAQGKFPVPVDHVPFWRVFVRFTLVGYGIALLISVVILWLFGRTDGLALEEVVEAAVVLGFPAAVGAGAARLLL